MEIDSRPNSRKKMFGQICDFNTKGLVQRGLDSLGKPFFVQRVRCNWTDEKLSYHPFEKETRKKLDLYLESGA